MPAFADLRCTQALTHAWIAPDLDDDPRGLAPVTHGPVQPVSWAHNPNVRTYAFDPVRPGRC
jgi:peptide/nickel transport system substrate-binding protein